MANPGTVPRRIAPVRESGYYRLVVEQVRSMIQDGTLPPGSQLPSEPELAKALNISRDTLRAALSYLETEGTMVRWQGVALSYPNGLIYRTSSISTGG